MRVARELRTCAEAKHQIQKRYGPEPGGKIRDPERSEGEEAEQEKERKSNESEKRTDPAHNVGHDAHRCARDYGDDGFSR